MESYSEYVFCASQAQQFEWVKHDYPQLYQRIQQKVIIRKRSESAHCFSAVQLPSSFSSTGSKRSVCSDRGDVGGDGLQRALGRVACPPVPLRPGKQLAAPFAYSLPFLSPGNVLALFLALGLM